MEIRIAVVAPYDELIADIRNLPASTTSVWQVRPGNLEEGVKVSKIIEEQGAHVIVSRGGTANAIRQAVSIPVIEIKVDGFDLARALSSLQNNYKHFGFIGFPNVIEGVERLGALLGFSIKEYPINLQKDVEGAVKQALEDEVDCIVGDKIATDTAQAAGLPSQLIKSGPESIRRALDEAYRVAEMRRDELNRIHKLRMILDTVSDGVIVTSHDGLITELNNVAVQLLNLGPSPYEGNDIKNLLPEWRKPLGTKQTHEFITKTKKGRTLFCSSRALQGNHNLSGYIITLQDVRQLQRIEENVRRRLISKGHTARYTFADILAESAVMKDAINRLVAYAGVDSTILILGESGCGKELAAQSIHNASPRKLGPFVAVNCAALPANLLETELFGYDEGAFTGARKSGKKGVFELAHNGTIFLDEIAEMPLELQGRLLRVLEEREIVKVGGETVIPVNIRVIAATNRDLAEEVTQGRFRKDLFYRINVLLVELPPLRQRTEDITTLAHAFLQKLKKKHKRELEWKKSGVETLLQYEWPGNVRELENIIERLVLTAPGPYLEEEHVQAIIGSCLQRETKQKQTHKPVDRKTYEQEAIMRMLQEGLTQEEIARRLQISRTTVWRRLKELDKQHSV